MNTLHLKYVVEVERTRSITQAAENLFMAQPNLSKAVRELEETMGFAIFERTSKGVFPTKRGSEFLVYAKNVLVQLERMDALAKPSKADVQSFNISIPRGSYIARSFTEFAAGLDAKKALELNVQETNSLQAIANVVEGQFNLGIIRYQVTYENYFLDYLADKQLNYEPIWDFEYLALMSKKHPLALTSHIEYSELKNYIEIVHGDTVIPYLSTDEGKKMQGRKAANKKIYVYERCSQFDLLENIPETFMWVSPVPAIFLERYGLVQRKCRVTNNRYKDILVYKKDYALSELDKLFIAKLHEIKNQVAAKKYS